MPQEKSRPTPEPPPEKLDPLVTGREAKSRRDTRLRDLLPALESLPRGQRDNLVEFLRALLHAYQVLSRSSGRKRPTR